MDFDFFLLVGCSGPRRHDETHPRRHTRGDTLSKVSALEKDDI